MAESAEELVSKTEEVSTVVDRGEPATDDGATLNSACTSNALRKTESQGDDTTSSYLTLNASNSTALSLEKEAVASLSGLGEGGGGGRRPLSVEVDEDGNHRPFVTAFSAGTNQSAIGGASLSTARPTSSFSSVSGLNSNLTTTATATTVIPSEEECNNSLASHCVSQSSGLVSNPSYTSVHHQPQLRTHPQKLEEKICTSDRNNTNTRTFDNTYNTDLVTGVIEGDGVLEGNSDIRYNNTRCIDNNSEKQRFSVGQSR